MVWRLARWTVLAILLCLAWIGVLHLTRGTAVRHVRGVAADGAAIGVDAPQFPLVVTMLTGAWLAPGTRAQVMLNGDGTFVPLWEDLRSAQQSITLQLYYGNGGRLSRTLAAILRERAAAARKTLYITNSYFAPDAAFAEQLAAAARRGVDVRILTAGPLTDVRIVRLAGRASYDTLLSAGARIYEWQPTTLHAKTFVIDGEWSTIGSMNFDNRSMALNDEATLMVLDRNLGAEMNRIFFDDLHHATEITRASLRERSWFQRIVERGANLITRLL